MKSLQQKFNLRKNWLINIHFTVIFFLGVFLIYLIGCNKKIEIPGPFVPIEDPDLISGMENLGSGYDVFEEFANASKVKAPVLDYKNLNSDGLVELKNLEHSTFHTTSGTSINQYSNSLGVSVGLEGSYMFFSGSVTTNFSQERYSYDSYSFATYHCTSNKYQLRLPIDWDATDLKKYLTSQAKTKLNDASIPATEIFRIYGTHCLTGVVVGGRLDYSISGQTSDVKTGVSVGVYAEASYSQGLGSGTLSTSVISQSEYNQFASNMEKHLEAYGGDSQYAHDIISKDDYTAWLSSIGNNMVFCDYTQNGLIPVWEFCDDASRKAALETAYATWATSRTIPVYPTPRHCILDVQVIEGANAANPYRINGRDYYRINSDLNYSCGSSTPYIWLYYLAGLENDTIVPIAEVATRDVTDGETLPSGFVEIPVDLNKGVGGDVIHLIYRKRNNHSDQLISGLRVQSVYSSGTSVSNVWHVVPIQINPTSPQDLNEGASVCGNKVWLYWTDDVLK